MAALHEQSISPAWAKADMEVHAKQDISLGIGEPLSALIILRYGGQQAEILTLVTAPEHRNTGLAQSLIRASEETILGKGGDIIFLEVAEDNDAALALYRMNGYEQFGRRPAYYRREKGRVAALTFRKRLDA